jgi:hypothetical protein
MPKQHHYNRRQLLQKVILAGAGLPLIDPTLRSSSAIAAPQASERFSHRLGDAEWVINDRYRIPVVVDPGSGKRIQTPVRLRLDFAEILKSQGVSGNLDQNSIRVVRYRPDSGRALSYQPDELAYEVPYQLGREFSYGDSGDIWWRIQTEMDTNFHIYFDILEGGRKPGPPTIALIGCGDNFRYNHGQPGPIDTAMSASIRYLDWDGDGKKDLLVGSSELPEFGMPKDHGFIYFFKNIGTSSKPLFAPGYELRDQEGSYVMSSIGPYMYFEVIDWDNAGKTDLLLGEGPTIYLVENTGKRGYGNLPVLRPPRKVIELKHGNDFTDDYAYRFFHLVDWDGDGGVDILYACYKQKVEQNCDNTSKICFYEEVLQFFELHENIGRDANGHPLYAAPRVVKTARGIPLTNFGYGGADYVDWDGDGKPDLISGDMQNDPPGASRVLFYQNAGTRSHPEFLLDIPIVARAEGTDIDPNPLVVDWDGDGDKDLILSGFEGWVQVYENLNPDPKGMPQLAAPRFVEQIHPLITEGEQSRTAVTDWNGDGRLDLIRGGGDGWVTYYENIGTNIDPVFRPGVRLKAAGQEIRLINGARGSPQGFSEPNSGYTAPVVVDFDGDGDLDLIVGDMRAYQTYFENVGTRTQPELAAGKIIEVDGEKRCFGFRNQVAVGDIDGDGQVEIVTTAYGDRHVYMYKPLDRQSNPGVLQLRRTEPLRLESGEILLPPHSGGNNNGDYMMKLVDWDDDGDLDLFVESVYWIWYYENVGTKTSPKFKFHGKVQLAGKDLVVSGHAGSIDAVDWNGDGRKDLIISGESGWVYYFERSFLEGNLPLARAHKIEARG